MSLKLPAVALGMALVCGSSDSAANETPRSSSLELLGGYGAGLGTFVLDAPNTYGWALGARAGTTLTRQLYLGGSFTDHLGWTASAREGTSTVYRASYHVVHAAAEVGWQMDAGRWRLRPYLGSGPLVSSGRTVVRGVVRNDAALLLHVVGGLSGAWCIDRWFVGMDVRMSVIPARPARDWAPAVFVSIGTAL